MSNPRSGKLGMINEDDCVWTVLDYIVTFILFKLQNLKMVQIHLLQYELKTYALLANIHLSLVCCKIIVFR